jgi:hypothetical protein
MKVSILLPFSRLSSFLTLSSEEYRTQSFQGTPQWKSPWWESAA